MIARSLLATLVALGTAAALGAWRGFASLGVPSGLVMAAGLVLVVGFQRIRGGRLALPPWHAVVGIFMFAFGAVSVARPDLVFIPAWMGGFTRIADAETPDRVYVDAALDGRVTHALARAVPAYRSAAAAMLGDLGDCPLDVVVTTRGRFDRVLDARGEFGFVHRPLIGRPTVVVPVGAGWGSLTHHAMQRWARCAIPDAPAWVVAGVASLVEKHTMDGDGFVLRWRSDWRVPESALASPPRDLVGELSSARDQGFLRSFFLFLHGRGHLAPMLAALRAGEAPMDALARATSSTGPRALEAEWRRWLHEEAGAIPTLPAARPFDDAPDL